MLSCLLFVSMRSSSSAKCNLNLLEVIYHLLLQDYEVCMVQVVHKEQYDEKRQVLQEATAVDDMYDMLAVYEQKVVTADQVRVTEQSSSAHCRAPCHAA